MMKFNFTKQIISAALVASVGFFGCQKNEMDEVDASLSATSEDLVIEKACGESSNQDVTRTYTVNLKEDKGKPEQVTYVDITGVLEMGNDKDNFYVQFSIPQDDEGNYSDIVKGIVKAGFNIGGTSYLKEFGAQDGEKTTLFTIPRSSLPGYPTANSVLISGAELQVRPSNDNGNWNSDPIITDVWEFVACPSEICSLDKDGWKNEENWPVSSLTIGLTTLNKGQLLTLLSTGNAGREAIKLAQALTVAELNKASSMKPDLDKAIKDARDLLSGVHVFEGADIKKITPGLIGKLHQLPSCE